MHTHTQVNMPDRLPSIDILPNRHLGTATWLEKGIRSSILKNVFTEHRSLFGVEDIASDYRG